MTFALLLLLAVAHGSRHAPPCRDLTAETPNAESAHRLVTAQVTVPATLSASVTPAEPRVAEPIELKVQVVTPETATVIFSDMAESDGWQVLSVADQSGATEEPGRRAHVRTWRLTSLTAGKKSVPSMDVMVDGQRLSTGEIPVVVTSVLTDTESAAPIALETLRGMKPPRDMDDASTQPETFASPKIIAATLVVLTFAAAGGVLAWRRRRTVVAPRDWAIGEIAKLRLSQRIVQPDEFDPENWRELSGLLREFVAYQTDVPALQRTPDELVGELQQQTQWTDSQIETLRDWLTQAERARYANAATTGHADPAKTLNQVAAWIDEVGR